MQERINQLSWKSRRRFLSPEIMETSIDKLKSKRIEQIVTHVYFNGKKRLFISLKIDLMKLLSIENRLSPLLSNELTRIYCLLSIADPIQYAYCRAINIF